MKKNVTPGETPEQITVSMIDQDLKDGISKPEMATKYGIKPWEVDEMFKHPFLKGRRPSRKKALSFTFVDDIDTPEITGIPNGDTMSDTDDEEHVDPNQITLEQAIDDASKSAEQAKEALKEAEEAIIEILSPEIETPEETLLKEVQKPEWTAKNKDGEEIKLDQEDQDALNEALDTHVNEDGQTLREAFDEELEDEDDDTFEL